MTMMPTIGGFAALDESQRELLWWCDVLEAVADFLPCRIDEQLCSRMSARLVPLVEETWMLAEPLLLSTADATAPDHLDNCGAARDVVALFAGLQAGEPLASPAAASHCLRSFTRRMRCRIMSERRLLSEFKLDQSRCDEPLADPAAA